MPAQSHPSEDTSGTVPLIQGFNELFGTAEGTQSSIGFRQGATLLISGPPGSGKTTFALATVRALMGNMWASKSNDSGQKKNAIAYYISSEVDDKTLQNSYKSFGWFAKKESDTSAPDQTALNPFCFRIDDPVPDETNFYTITPLPEVDRPVPSPEELVNRIFNRIAHTLSPSEAPKEYACIYVIVDSISALLKGCANPGEERRQTHEIMHRLRDRFGPDKLALTILLAEQDHRAQDVEMTGAPIIPTTPSIEDYLADIVFRLYVRSLPLGRRSRVLEVVKSQGVNMILGEHSWQIITEDNFKQILRHRGMQLAIKKACLESLTPEEARKKLKETLTTKNESRLDESREWGGIILFPRPQLQRHSPSGGDPKRHEDSHGENLGSGTKGLEDLIVKLGTTTLIAGPVGSGKTKLCRQFLTATKSATPKSATPRSATPRSAKPRSAKPVLVSFDIFPTGNRDNEIELLDFTQSKFDLNVLVAHIKWILSGDNNDVPERLAFDGLSEWITMFEKPEAARMLEALMITVRQAKRTPAVFMTYELRLDDDPLGPHALGMSAENIVVVRQIAINDQLRRILYVLKREGWQTEPEVPRELIFKQSEDKPFPMILEVVEETLDSYTGLLGKPGDLKPAKILLLLFAENKRQQALNADLYSALSRQHEGRLEITHSEFSRSEIGSTLDSASKDRSPGESASLKVQSVDEWWLGTPNTGQFLRDIRNLWNGSETVGWSDYWSFEVEKATFKPAKGDNTTLAIHAIPAYMDFGMLCINHSLWLKGKRPPRQERTLHLQNEETRQDMAPASQLETIANNDTLRGDWTDILSEVPRLWAQTDKSENVEWFKVDAKSKTPKTLLGYALRMTGQENTEISCRKPVFTFDMATRETSVCMFLEFAWAFGAREEMLGVSEAHDRNREKARAIKALTFLQFMVLEGLMPERGSIEAANEILFSRHFYSTLPKGEKEEKGTKLIALPFMPTGLVGRKNALASAIADIKCRLKCWCERAERNIASRKDKQLLAKVRKWQKSGKSDGSASDQVDEAIECYGWCRKIVMNLAGQSKSGPTEASGKSSDIGDLIELTSWAAFRLQLLVGEDNHCFPARGTIGKETEYGLAGALNAMRTQHYHLPNPKSFKIGTEIRPVLTGYCCTGSWMYGISKRSRAPALQAQVLMEMTSLDWAEKRAKNGCGMPARKDFFQLHGGDNVPGMEYLNWREFLRYNGSRARRRDRVLGDKMDTRLDHTVIHRELLACLRIAGLGKHEYAVAKTANRKQLRKMIIEAVTDRARTAVDEIFRTAEYRPNSLNDSAQSKGVAQ